MIDNKTLAQRVLTEIKADVAATVERSNKEMPVFFENGIADLLMEKSTDRERRAFLDKLAQAQTPAEWQRIVEERQAIVGVKEALLEIARARR